VKSHFVTGHNLNNESELNVDNIHHEEFNMEEELKLREYDYAKPTIKQ
jgi:hypothetical protein